MFVWVFKYTGPGCHGGYVCIAETIGDAMQALAERTHLIFDHKSIDDLIHELFDTNEHGYFQFLSQTKIELNDIKSSMVLLDSWGCSMNHG